MKFEFRTLVCAEMDFPSLDAAIEWAQEHTIFDMFDKGAVNGEVWIYDETGDQVGEA